MRLIQVPPIICLYMWMLLHLFSCQPPKPSNSVYSFPLSEITITDIQNSYGNGSFTVRKIVELYLDRIENIDRNGPKLNSIIIVNPDALQIADSLDQIIKLGNEKGALFGIPVLLKDNINANISKNKITNVNKVIDRNKVIDVKIKFKKQDINKECIMEVDAANLRIIL